MAIALGTNSGFVSSAPSADPEGSTSGALGGYAYSNKHTSPSGTNIVTEIGFWQDRTDNSACSYNAGIYSHDAAKACPNVLIATQCSGNSVAASTAGWNKYESLSISLDASTTYWITIGYQDVTNDVKCNYGSVTGGANAYVAITGPTLATDWDETIDDGGLNYSVAIYALYAAAGGWRKIRDNNAGMDIFGDRVGGVF